TQIGSADKRYFVGLPSPSAAAVVAGTVWSLHVLDQSPVMAILAALVVATAGILMVSNVRYHSFKDLDLKGRVPFVAILLVVFGFAVISLAPAHILLAIFLIYLVSGPVMALVRQNRKNGADSQLTEE